jgi:hypothetical protein
MFNIRHATDNVPYNCGIALTIIRTLDSPSFALIYDSLIEPSICHRSVQTVSV